MIKKIKITPALIVLILISLLGAFLIGLALVNYARQAGLALAFRYPLDYGEGPLLDQTLRLIRGENLYSNSFAEPPYTISNYPPVFLLLQAPFAAVFGPAFWYGRAISLIAALVAALMVGLTLYTLTGDGLGSAFGGLLLLTFPYIQYWSLLNRIDALALGLSWVGIFVLVRWSDRRWGVPVAAVFLLLSIYTRQSYALAAPAGAFIWLLAMRKFRKAIELALEVGIPALLLFGVINLITQGGFFLNIVTANVNPFYWDSVKHNFNELWEHTMILVIFIGVYLAAERFGTHTRTWPLVLPYLIGATLSGITIGKDGSNVNYLFELAAALALGGGAALAWAGRSHWVRAGVVVILALLMSQMLSWTRSYNGRITEKTDNEAEISRLYEVVRGMDGIVLADEYMGLLPLAGKELYYQPFEYKMLAEGGLWDQQPFMDEIRNHKFAGMVLYDPVGWSSFEARWTWQERQLINSVYREENTIAHTRVLLPR